MSANMWEVSCMMEYSDGRWSLHLILGRFLGPTMNYVSDGYTSNFRVNIDSEPVENLQDVPYITEGVRNAVLWRLASGKVDGGGRGKTYYRVQVPDEDVDHFKHVALEYEAKKETK